MIGVEGADQGEEEPSHHHVATGMSLPHEPSHVLLRTAGAVGLQIAAVGLQVAAVFNFKLSESCKDLCLFLLFGSGRPWVDTLFGFSEHVGQTDEHGGEPLVGRHQTGDPHHCGPTSASVLLSLVSGPLQFLGFVG
jgi:hypothetical protein